MTMKLQFGEYWVAEVSLRKGNPPHRVIAVCLSEDGDYWELYSHGYDSRIEISVPAICGKIGGSFRLVEQIQGIGPDHN